MTKARSTVWWYVATACVILLAGLCGCAGVAAKQYEEAHERYLSALDRVTVLESEIEKAKIDGDETLAALKQKAAEVARRAAEEAAKVRSETRHDAAAEAEASRGFWSSILAMTMLALKTGASLIGSAGKAVA